MLLTWTPSNGLQAVVALSPQAWFRYGLGITVTGAGVSTWADQSGNGRDLLQGTDAARPTLQADGSILFDGVDNFLKTAAFTLNQPNTIYILCKAITWTDVDFLYDGDTLNNSRLIQSGVTPDLAVGAGADIALPGPTVGAYAIITAVRNSASSSGRINSGAAVTGDAGLNNMDGFTLGTRGDLVGNFSNIQVKEVILFSGAHTDTQQSQIIYYLSRML